jgi:pimeloyl-ACP methyl ester carboxylesterase
MAAITNLSLRVSYPVAGNSYPVLLLMHGFGGDASEYNVDTLARLAAYGLFVGAVGMRGRDSASGSRDSSGREIYDILDALTYIRANYASVIDANYAAIAGHSGGGGNALAAACKAPDTFVTVVSCYGMSDYGVNNPNGWYWNGGSQATLQTQIGGTPVAVPNNYLARDATSAISNYTGGHLYLYHDSGDASVPIIHSQRIVTAMGAAGLSNYTANYTGVSDNPRWLHAIPNGIAPIIQSEAIWARAIADKTYAVWTVPDTGTLKIIGYLVTKRFNLWLGDGTGEAGQVVYNMTTRVFTITPTTGASTFSLTLKGQAVSASVSATINGVGDTQTSDGSGNVTFTGSV